MAAAKANYCPKCGYEYEQWVEACPDCGVALVSDAERTAGAPQLDPDTDPHWTVVGNVPNAILGSLVKSQIEAAGIPVLMFRTRYVDIAEFSHNDFVPQDLLVPRDRVTEARAIMDVTDSPGYSTDLWANDHDSEYEDDEEEAEADTFEQATGGREESENRSLPEGWSVLPGADEAESHNSPDAPAAPPGWYWSGSSQRDQEAPRSAAEEEQPPAVRRIPLSYERQTRGHRDTGYASGDWYKPSRLTRVIYAILILTMGLPFILQIFEYLASIFRR